MSETQFQVDGEEDATVYMEEVLEKLKLLNYERDFATQNGLKLLNRAYFAVSLNPNEQFNYFTRLAQWLFKLNNSNVEFNQFGDPISIANNIQFELKKIGLDNDFQPIKLRSGSGEIVCKILLDLANRALKTKNFAFKKPKMEQPSQNADEETRIEGNDEDADMAENISIASQSDGEYDDMGEPSQQKKDVDEDKEIIQSKINEKDWIIEVERVTPKLKIQVKNEAKEWRSHIEQTKEYNSNVKKTLPEARQRLEKLVDNLSKVLDQIQKREKSINSNLTDLGGEYRAKSENYKNMVTQYNNLQASVKEQGEQYRQLKEKYDSIKSIVEAKGEEQTNSSPVIKIKDAIKKIREEIGQMDVRIGILSQTVLQHKLRQKQSGVAEEDEEHLDELEGENVEEDDVVDF
ncbi:intraflagellar transporter-like protein (macronuclear) [Tetrahymena thermophila SB210]|uniref:Intraflagellar transporter-like protein n=1 Tax=Tetrahymena thermophila (strain SB210) TaxID=312017 RepID=Q22A13_TETTS|nr:intraflagellar transporter-like protein [Tetrahymena thermophila SB210]EAR82129.3 intraflagellar transporter-like protein [Tetrahymena thermophila SB210]|eukprot:XP_001029792.3 intraflagellar transporter-like protein [Tetrahymena thermophila SB210]